MDTSIDNPKLTRSQDFVREDLVGLGNVFFLFGRMLFRWLDSNPETGSKEVMMQLEFVCFVTLVGRQVLGWAAGRSGRRLASA